MNEEKNTTEQKPIHTNTQRSPIANSRYAPRPRIQGNSDLKPLKPYQDKQDRVVMEKIKSTEHPPLAQKQVAPPSKGDIPPIKFSSNSNEVKSPLEGSTASPRAGGMLHSSQPPKPPISPTDQFFVMRPKPTTRGIIDARLGGSLNLQQEKLNVVAPNPATPATPTNPAKKIDPYRESIE